MPTTKAKNLLYRLALPFCSAKPPQHPIINSDGCPICFEQLLTGIIRRNHIFGAAISLKSEKKQAAVFTSHIHTKCIPRYSTYYRVASITKMATSLIATALMDRGIIDSKKPVAEMIPGGSNIPELRGIYIDQLLSHTSGLIDPANLEDLLLQRTPLGEALKGRRKFEPGTAFHYSNLGFGLIGSILEAALDLSVEEVFQKFLFHPLKMNATLEGSSLDESSIMPVIRILPLHSLQGITVTKLGRKPIGIADPEYHFGYTAGSMYTTLTSLVKMIECIRDGGKPLLSEAFSNYMTMESAQYGRLSPTLSYGHGILRIRDKRVSDHIVYGHQGFAYGCVDGAFWEDSTGNIIITLNGGCSEARSGRLGRANIDLCRFAFRKEIPMWNLR